MVEVRSIKVNSLVAWQRLLNLHQAFQTQAGRNQYPTPYSVRIYFG